MSPSQIMDAEKLAKVQAHATAIAALLYEETDPEQVKTLEGIEQAIRGHLLETVGPQMADFLSKRVAEQAQAASGESRASSEQ